MMLASNQILPSSQKELHINNNPTSLSLESIIRDQRVRVKYIWKLKETIRLLVPRVSLF
jgi:hypothetical protein